MQLVGIYHDALSPERQISQNTVIASGITSKSQRWLHFQVVQGSWVSNFFREGYKVHLFHFHWFNHSNRNFMIIKPFKNSRRSLDHFIVLKEMKVLTTVTRNLKKNIISAQFVWINIKEKKEHVRYTFLAFGNKMHKKIYNPAPITITNENCILPYLSHGLQNYNSYISY